MFASLRAREAELLIFLSVGVAFLCVGVPFLVEVAPGRNTAIPPCTKALLPGDLFAAMEEDAEDAEEEEEGRAEEGEEDELEDIAVLGDD